MSYLLAPFVFESVPNVMPFVSTYMSASAIVMVNARTASSLGSTVHPRARQAVETLLVAVVIHDELRNAELGLDEGHRTGAAQLVEDRGLRAPSADRLPPPPDAVFVRRAARTEHCDRCGTELQSIADRRHRGVRLDLGVLPGAVRDPDTGDWICDAEVAEIDYTAFASTKDRVTAAWWCAGSKTPAMCATNEKRRS